MFVAVLARTVFGIRGGREKEKGKREEGRSRWGNKADFFFVLFFFFS
jgi:hypothetical protein